MEVELDPLIVVWSGKYDEYVYWCNQARRYPTSTGFRYNARVISVTSVGSADWPRGLDLRGARLVRYGSWRGDRGIEIEMVAVLRHMGMKLEGHIDLGFDLIPPRLSVRELVADLAAIATRLA